MNIWQKLAKNEVTQDDFPEWCEWWARFYMSKKDFREQVEKILPDLSNTERYKALLYALEDKLLMIHYNPETKCFRLAP